MAAKTSVPVYTPCSALLTVNRIHLAWLFPFFLLLACGEKPSVEMNEYEKYYGKTTFDYKKDLMPSSVKYTVKGRREHEYIITDEYLRFKGDSTIYGDLYVEQIPGCVTAAFDFTRKTFTFVTRSRLNELPSVINRAARFGGMIPYWRELEIRDAKDPRATTDYYHLIYTPNKGLYNRGNVKYEEKPDAGLLIHFYSPIVNPDGTFLKQSFLLSKSNSEIAFVKSGEDINVNWSPIEEAKIHSATEFSITYDKGTAGYLRFNPRIGMCRCHDFHTMRIFNKEGKWIWEHTIGGMYKPYVMDFDKDGLDEIVLFQQDHGSGSILFYARNGPIAQMRNKNPEHRISE